MTRLDLDSIRVVAWDFDGVLNRNIENGVWAWSRHFERDLGLPHHSFRSFLFRGRFQEAMLGKACLLELVTEWAHQNGAPGRAEEILDYWFRADALPDIETLAIVGALKARGITSVMATNNEARRTDFIEHQMGFRAHVDHIFAAGRMGMVKPEANYFIHIEETLGVSPEGLLLVDDMEENVMAARARGWQAFHFVEGSHGRLAEALSIEVQPAS